MMMTMDRRWCGVSADVREGSFLFQRVSVDILRFSSVLLHDAFCTAGPIVIHFWFCLTVLTLETYTPFGFFKWWALGDRRPPPRQLIPQNCYNWRYSAVVKIPLWNSWIWIRISIKIEWFVALIPHEIFVQNSLTTSWVSSKIHWVAPLRQW